MKTPKSHYLLLMLIFACLTSSGRITPGQIPFKHIELPVYQADPFALQAKLEFAYAEAAIQKPANWLELQGENLPYEIDLVFTKYPSDFSRWRTDYDQLLTDRLNALIELDSTLLDKNIRWNMILQTRCKTEGEAKRFFHGFVIKYRPKSYQIIDDVKSPQDLQALMTGAAISRDSTVIKVIARHPEWKDMLVVVDWTGSMYQYGAQLVLWHKQNLLYNQNQTRHMVFFNDGNMKKQQQKVIGKTGGIYCAAANELDKIVLTMEKVMLKGDGGDTKENDLEALLKAMQMLEGYQDVVLIADNKSDVRDIALLSMLDKPVHVILCGIEEDNYINTDYVKIAYQSGGSLHTISEDLEELRELKPGERMAIGNMKYEIKNGGISQVAHARE